VDQQASGVCVAFGAGTAPRSCEYGADAIPGIDFLERFHRYVLLDFWIMRNEHGVPVSAKKRRPGKQERG
jgi:hypothetical protein